MGAVYLAHDAHLDRWVALKVPRPGLDNDGRFLREARAAAMVRHPGLCPVYDVGHIDGVLYLSMAYIEGQPLSAFLQLEQAPSPREALEIAGQIALAMHEAHQRGIIHRDLKPANVMIDLRRQPIIMDFGLARRGPETGDIRLTQSGVIMGTPAYMSPEQVNGAIEAMGPACDIYSLGVMLYELLAGRLPFLGSAGEVMAQIATATPPPPSQFQASLDPQLDAICLRALAKNPAERFASMQDFATALQGCLRRNASDCKPAPTTPAPAGNVVGSAGPPASDDVRRLCLAARYFLEKRTEDGNRKSIATYYEVLDKNPSYAPAWAGLAFAYHLLGVRGHASPTGASPKGKSAALHAIELDPSLAEAHTNLGIILMDYDWDFAGAERSFRHALELKPDHASAHHLYGKCLACMGRHAEAVTSIRRAQELQPLATIYSATLARHGYFYARMYDQAVHELRKIIETEPAYWIAHYFLGWAYVCQENLSDALEAFTTANRIDDNPETLVGLGYAHAVSGQPNKAHEVLNTLTEIARRRYVGPINQAVIYIGLGDQDQAIAWLEKAFDEHSEWLCKIRVDPVFDPLRSDAWFHNLLDRVTGRS